jgi:hypothetical protein
MFLLISYIGVALTAIWLTEKLIRLLTPSTLEILRDSEPADLRTLVAFARAFLRKERIVSLLFVSTSAGLVAKYMAGWVGPPGYFLEDINLLCIIFVWLDFRLTGGPSEHQRRGSPV